MFMAFHSGAGIRHSRRLGGKEEDGSQGPDKSDPGCHEAANVEAIDKCRGGGAFNSGTDKRMARGRGSI